MTWTSLTFSSGEKLSATQMNQFQDNFSALAQGHANAPALSVNSFMVSGVSSMGALHVSSGLVSPETSSFSLAEVSSGVRVSGNPGGIPVANTLYARNIPKAWGAFNGTTNSLNASFNIIFVADLGVGAYQFGFEVPFLTANNPVAGSVHNTTGSLFLGFQSTGVNSNINLFSTTYAGNNVDGSIRFVIFGDQ